MKLLIVGPSKSHKSALASFVTGAIDNLGGSPGPTMGCRILQSETRERQPFELWDVSGDQRYETTWPAIQKDADGILFVYAPEIPGAAKEVELWWEWFVARTSVSPQRCSCFSLTAGGASAGGPLPSIEAPVEKLSIEDADAVRRAFDKWVSRVAASISGSSRR